MGNNNGEEVDRVPPSMRCVSINCLPDELLVHILSFLTTKEAGSTSVLSKKWRTLFAYSPNLDFNDSTFWIPEETIMERGDDILEGFRVFVDRTLALQGSVHIKKFSLTCRDEHKVVDVDRWINSVMARGVSQVDLNLYDVMRRLLPTSLYMSKTMVKLTLGTKLILDSFPSDMSLPLLKVLFLDSIWFDNQGFGTGFLAACPALEDLTIHHKSFPGMPYVISSKTVKRLSITYVDRAVWLDVSSFISLDTPNVVDLYYFDNALPRYLDFNLNSLAKATLDLHFLKYEDYNDEPLLIPDVTDLMNGIRNVKILDLTSSAVKVISICCERGLPVFKNLVGLVFSGRENLGWKILLPLLIELSPNLKSLDLSGVDICPSDRIWKIHIPSSNQVKFLRILKYQGSANELKHISHFLLEMKCLELVRVCVSSAMDDSEKMQITEDLLKLPTASSNLTMEIK